MTSLLESVFVNRGYEPLMYQLDAAGHASVEDLYRLYNPTGGPVRKVATYLGPGGGFHVNVGHCAHYELDHVLQKLTSMPSLDTGARNTLFGGGKGHSMHDMLVSSLGEGVERALGALAYFLGRAEPIFGSYRSLTRQGIPCVAPEEMPLFSAQQYADPDFFYEPFTADCLLGWIEGHRLLSGEAVWVPSQLVELLHLGPPNEAKIGYSQSGGLSCHIDQERALYHGITELMERDAVNLRWYLWIPPDEIVFDREPSDPQVAGLVAELGLQPGTARYLHHSLDLPDIPVITVVRFDPWLDVFSYSAGGGVDTDAEAALLKALSEFGQSERTIRMAVMSPLRAVSGAVDEMFGVAADAAIESLTLFVQVIGYYGHTSNQEKMEWYLKGNRELPLSEMPVVPADPKVRYNHLLDILRTHKIDPIVFDFTPPGLDQLKLMKVYIPELTQPFLQSRPMFGHPRFHDIAEQFGHLRVEGFDEFNPDPLPYP